jgi:voltage-gated potassium channel
MQKFKPKVGFKSQFKNSYLPAVILTIVIFGGTFGYHILWRNTNSTFMDELYMTVITITTVGFYEVHPLNTSGRILTMIIAVSGISSLFYLFSVVMENLVFLQLSNTRGIKKMEKILSKVSNHLIIIGYGRVGKLALNELLHHDDKILVINDNFSEEETAFLTKNNILMVTGDATNDEILKNAMIERARGMIVTTANPATTVFVILSAKVFNPKLFIVARVDDHQSIQKLKIAGADRIVNPYQIGGQRLAHLMVNSHLVDFLETSFGSSTQGNLSIETIEIPENSDWIGQSISEIDFRNIFGITILAVIRSDFTFTNPQGNFVLNKFDNIVAFGTKSNLTDLNKQYFAKK